MIFEQYFDLLEKTYDEYNLHDILKETSSCDDGAVARTRGQDEEITNTVSRTCRLNKDIIKETSRVLLQGVVDKIKVFCNCEKMMGGAL